MVEWAKRDLGNFIFYPAYKIWFGEEAQELFGKEKILQFLEEVSIWYDKTTLAVKQYADNKYRVKDISDSDIELMAIFIRFEQNEPALFGLSYKTEFDVEHGCGIKMKGNDQQFKIVEIGCADVAFCLLR